MSSTSLASLFRSTVSHAVHEEKCSTLSAGSLQATRIAALDTSSFYFASRNSVFKATVYITNINTAFRSLKCCRFRFPNLTHPGLALPAMVSAIPPKRNQLMYLLCQAYLLEARSNRWPLDNPAKVSSISHPPQ